MKRNLCAICLLLSFVTASFGQYNPNIVNNQVDTDVAQNTNVVGGGASESNAAALGGAASADGGDSSAGAYINYAPSSTANYKTRVPPLGFVPPYLPMWQHGGWGTTQGYFPNGPTTDDRAYERMFDPEAKEDIQMLKQLLRSAPYANGFKAIGGLFTPALKTHRLRGFSVANALIRDERPEGKRFMIMIDNDVDRNLLMKAGYAYVGKISVEGKSTRNWDQCYGAIIAETIPWDVDIILLSGGMKGVTIGQNVSFGGGGGYSQPSYSLSLFGSKSSGVTEGKGKPLLGAECYRYNPQLNAVRNNPRQFYQMLQVRYANNAPAPQTQPQSVTTAAIMPTAAASPGVQTKQTQSQTKQYPSVSVNAELMDMAGVKPMPYIDYVAAQPVTVNP